MYVFFSIGPLQHIPVPFFTPSQIAISRHPAAHTMVFGDSNVHHKEQLIQLELAPLILRSHRTSHKLSQNLPGSLIALVTVAIFLTFSCAPTQRIVMLMSYHQLVTLVSVDISFQSPVATVPPYSSNSLPVW